MGAGGTGSLGTQEVVSVTLQSMAAGSIEKEPVTKKLPGNFQIGKLKLLCKRLFDLDVELQTLYFEVGEKQSGMVPTLLDDDESTIGFFGVVNGATIFMNEIDLKQKQQEQEAWAEEQRRRETEQQRRLQSMQVTSHTNFGETFSLTNYIICLIIKLGNESGPTWRNSGCHEVGCRPNKVAPPPLRFWCAGHVGKFVGLFFRFSFLTI